MKQIIAAIVSTVLLQPLFQVRAEDKMDVPKTPVDMFSKVVASSSLHDSHTQEVAFIKSQISEWQAATKAKKTKDPLRICADTDMALTLYLTPDVVEKALGKPDRKTTGTIPFVFSQSGNINGPVLWYGDIGFCFGNPHLRDSSGKEEDFLFMMRLESTFRQEADSKVTFDNKSGKPALVKLVGPTASSVSVENSKTESVSIAPGHYYIKIRYGTPGAYAYSKGDEFDVTETATTASDITITLHKVVAGNYSSKSISEEEFGAVERMNKQASYTPQSVMEAKGVVATADAADTDKPTAATNVAAAWKTNMTVFVNELYDCVRRCPEPAGGFRHPGAPIEQNPFAIFLKLNNGSEYGAFDDDTPLGKTTQGEINRLVGDGTFVWVSRVTTIENVEESPEKSQVTVEFPEDIPSPIAKWVCGTGGVNFPVEKAGLQKLQIRVGSQIQFTGSVAKKKGIDNLLTGVTALHALKGVTTNIINIRVDEASVKILKVVQQASDKKP